MPYQNLQTIGMRKHVLLWLWCIYITKSNSTKIVSVEDYPHGTDCEKACKITPHCLAHYSTHIGVSPKRCKLALHDGISNVYPEQISPDFGNATELNCSVRGNQTCYKFSKICVACPERPTDWIQNVGPNYTVVFASSCCLAAHTDTTVPIRIKEPLTLPYSNITLQGFMGSRHDNFILNSSVCPMINVTTPYSVPAAIIQNLNIYCPQNTSNAAAILISRAQSFKLTAINVSSQYSRSAIMMIGGNHDPDLTPYSSMITTGTSFNNIRALPGSYPNPAAVALANTEGNRINISGFQPNQLIVVQPYLGELGYANSLNIVDGNTPRIFNISAFTEVFGQLYELDFFNRNAGEKNEYSESLKQLFIYQGYIFVGLLVMLLVVHQDIVYYVIVKSREKAAKQKQY